MITVEHFHSLLVPAAFTPDPFSRCAFPQPELPFPWSRESGLRILYPRSERPGARAGVRSGPGAAEEGLFRPRGLVD
jgi:hypothetical protein